LDLGEGLFGCAVSHLAWSAFRRFSGGLFVGLVTVGLGQVCERRRELVVDDGGFKLLGAGLGLL
jgi:hypothetical protein